MVTLRKRFLILLAILFFAFLLPSVSSIPAVQRLTDLWDVSTAGAADGDVLTKTSRGWKAVAPSAGGTSLFTGLDFTGTTGFADFTDDVDDGQWVTGTASANEV